MWTGLIMWTGIFYYHFCRGLADGTLKKTPKKKGLQDSEFNFKVLLLYGKVHSAGQCILQFHYFI